VEIPVVLNNIDIVAFLDADIKNPTEDMVLGTIGPLVLEGTYNC